MAVRRLPPAWLVLHKWVGLILALWIVLQGVTGAVLAYKLELQAALAPRLYRTGVPVTHIDYDRIFRTVTLALPDRRIGHFERDALAPDESIRVITHPKGGPQSVFDETEVFVDPATMQIIGSRSSFTFIKALWLLHTGLIAGRGGEVFVGFLGLFLISSLIAGIVLWWPTRGKWKRALQLRLSSATPRLIHDLHTVAGAYFVIVFLVISATGLVVIFPKPVSAFVDAFAEMRPPTEFTADTVMPGVKRELTERSSQVSLNSLAATVESLYPGAEATLLLFPHTSEKGTYTFRVIPRGEDRTLRTTQVYMHQTSGKVVGRFDPVLQPAANTFVGLWSVYVHTGLIAGLAGRILVIVSGIALGTMAFTGLYVWLKKRPARRRSHRLLDSRITSEAC